MSEDKTNNNTNVINADMLEKLMKISTQIMKNRQVMTVGDSVNEISKFKMKSFLSINIPDDGWKSEAFENLTTKQLIDILRRIGKLKSKYPLNAEETELQINKASIVNVLLHLHAFLYEAYLTTKSLGILFEKSSLEVVIRDYYSVIPKTNLEYSALVDLESQYISIISSIQKALHPHLSIINEKTKQEKENAGVFLAKLGDKKNSLAKVFVVNVMDSAVKLESYAGEFLRECRNKIEMIIADSYAIISKIQKNSTPAEDSTETHHNLLNQIYGMLTKEIQKQTIRRLYPPKLMLKLHTCTASYNMGPVPYRIISRIFIPSGSQVSERMKNSYINSKQMSDSRSLLESADNKIREELNNELSKEANIASSESKENEVYLDSQNETSWGLNTEVNLDVDYSNEVGNQAIAKQDTSVNFDTSISFDYNESNATQQGSNTNVLQAIDRVTNVIDNVISNNVAESNTQRQSYVTTSSEINSTETKEESTETITDNQKNVGITYVFYSCRERLAYVTFIEDISLRFSNVFSWKNIPLSNISSFKKYVTDKVYESILDQIRRACVLPDIYGQYQDSYEEYPVPHFSRQPFYKIATPPENTNSDEYRLYEELCGFQGVPLSKEIAYVDSPGVMGAAFITCDIADMKEVIEQMTSLSELQMRIQTNNKLLEHSVDAESTFKLLVNAQDLMNKNILLSSMVVGKDTTDPQLVELIKTGKFRK